MQFVYGSFQGQSIDNWAPTASNKTAVYTNGELTSILASMEFQAVIVANNQYDLTRRFRTIKNGIQYNGYDAGLLHDDGSPSEWFLDSSESQSGVRITKYPFPEPNIPGADYASSLTCRVAFEAEYSAPQVGGGGGVPGNVLVSYTESFSRTGDGGQRTAIQEYITGAPEEFILADRTACYAVQRGAAAVEGFSKDQFALVSTPLFPDRVEHDSMGEVHTITRLTDGKWNCAIEWEYRFKSTALLTGGTLPGR